MIRIRTISMMVLVLLAVASAAPAAAETLYGSGDVALSWARLGFGGESGVFEASGALWPSGAPEPAETGAGGLAGVWDGQWLIAAIGVAAGTQVGTVDAAVVLVRGDGDVVPGPGTWPVALDEERVFALAFGVETADLPEVVTPEALAALLQSVEADRVLVAVSGEIVVEAVDSNALRGSFRGTMVDRDAPLFIVTTEDGLFDLGGGATADEAVSVSRIKRLWR